MRDNPYAVELYVTANVVAADIHKLDGDLARYERCLEDARSAARTLLTKFGESSAAIHANTLLAAYEEDWPKAAAHHERVVRMTLWNLGVGFRLLLFLHGQITAEEFARGDAVITLLLQGRSDEAKRAFETWLSREIPSQISSFRSSRSHVFTFFSMLGRPQDAIEYSKSFLARIGTPIGKIGAYYETVDRYVCGEASAEDLLAAAENSARRRHRLHAHYLLGVERLSKSDRQEAVKHFEEIERAGSYLFYSQPWAAHHLKHLRDDTTWPPWIPVKDPAGPSQK